MKYDPHAAAYLFEVDGYSNISEEETALKIARKHDCEAELLAILTEQKKGNGYRRNGKSLLDIITGLCTKGTALVKYGRIPRVYSVDNDFLAVENIQCVDAEDNVFEQYDLLFVRKDIERDESGKLVNFTPNCAVAHFEKEDPLFLPSFALSCNIVAALEQNKDSCLEVKPVLMQYKNLGAGHGWHAQNTVIDWGEQKVIHYPHKNDFPELGGKTGINQAHQRTLLPFTREEKRRILPDRTLSDMTLEKGLKDPLMTRFVRQLTGLENPSVLVEIGNYFGKTARVWVSSSNETGAAWFGCNSNNLYLGGNSNLDSNSAARGVRKI